MNSYSILFDEVDVNGIYSGDPHSYVQATSTRSILLRIKKIGLTTIEETKKTRITLSGSSSDTLKRYEIYVEDGIKGINDLNNKIGLTSVENGNIVLDIERTKLNNANAYQYIYIKGESSTTLTINKYDYSISEEIIPRKEKAQEDIIERAGIDLINNTRNGESKIVKNIYAYDFEKNTLELYLVFNVNEYNNSNIRNTKYGKGWRLNYQEEVFQTSGKYYYIDSLYNTHEFKLITNSTNEYVDIGGTGLILKINNNGYEISDGLIKKEFNSNGWLTYIRYPDNYIQITTQSDGTITGITDNINTVVLATQNGVIHITSNSYEDTYLTISNDLLMSIAKESTTNFAYNTKGINYALMNAEKIYFEYYENLMFKKVIQKEIINNVTEKLLEKKEYRYQIEETEIEISHIENETSITYYDGYTLCGKYLGRSEKHNYLEIVEKESKEETYYCKERNEKSFTNIYGSISYKFSVTSHDPFSQSFSKQLLRNTYSDLKNYLVFDIDWIDRYYLPGTQEIKIWLENIEDTSIVDYFTYTFNRFDRQGIVELNSNLVGEFYVKFYNDDSYFLGDLFSISNVRVIYGKKLSETKKYYKDLSNEDELNESSWNVTYLSGSTDPMDFDDDIISEEDYIKTKDLKIKGYLDNNSTSFKLFYNNLRDCVANVTGVEFYTTNHDYDIGSAFIKTKKNIVEEDQEVTTLYIQNSDGTNKTTNITIDTNKNITSYNIYDRYQRIIEEFKPSGIKNVYTYYSVSEGMQLKKIQIRGRNYSSTLKTQIIEYTYTNSGFNKYEVKINGTTKERYTYDSRNRVTIITDGLGNQIKQEYSGENLYRIYTNGISDQIVYGYSYGKLISATDNYAIVNKTDNGYDTVNYNLNNNNNILNKTNNYYSNYYIDSLSKYGSIVNTNKKYNGKTQNIVQGTDSVIYTYDTDEKLIEIEDNIGSGDILITYDNERKIENIESTYHNDELDFGITYTNQEISGIEYRLNNNLIKTKAITRDYSKYDNRITSLGETISGNDSFTTYYTYDEFDRISEKNNLYGTGLINIERKTFNDTNGVTDKITNIEYLEGYQQQPTTIYNFSINYDGVGNITKVEQKNSSNTTIQKQEFLYDLIYRLTKEDNYKLNQTFKYTYNNGGNITKRQICAYKTNTVQKTYEYEYSTTNKDVLVNVKIDNTSYPVTNNTNGYITSYKGINYTHTNNRLTSIYNTLFSVTTNYMYNKDKVLYKKQTGSFITKYYLEGSRIIKENRNGTDITYLYTDSIIGMKYQGTTYYFRKNIFGDIIEIKDVSNGVVARYIYDAYGNTKVCNPNYTENTSSTFIGNINPFRYRSYYFDKDSGMYYCESRFYHPELCRWIEPDIPTYLDIASLNGLNLYTYCSNNPVMYKDENGNFSLLISVLVGATIGFACSYISDVATNFKDGFDWSDFNTFRDNWTKYLGATLGGAIGGLGFGIGTNMLFGGIGNIISGAFSGEVTSLSDGLLQFAIGAVVSGVAYEISKGISAMFASSRVFKIIGSSTKASKINANLSKNGFNNMKVGKMGITKIAKELYKKLGYKDLQDGISFVLEFGMGFIF